MIDEKILNYSDTSSIECCPVCHVMCYDNSPLITCVRKKLNNTAEKLTKNSSIHKVLEHGGKTITISNTH